jgi:nucleotidyltransferase/DNA polymerase involved in DNA repair
MWQVANGLDNEPVLPRRNHISLSNESTLEFITYDKEIIKQSLYELIDELYERIKNNKYQFRTVGIKIMRTDFSIETREKSYIKYQSERKSIESLIEEVLDKFDLEDNNLVIPTRKFLPIRKVGLKVSNLIAIEKSNKDNEYKQKTLLDYC